MRTGDIVALAEDGYLVYRERIEWFELVPTEWTPENDPFTPSLEKKRRNITDRFDAELGRIYAVGRPADDWSEGRPRRHHRRY